MKFLPDKQSKRGGKNVSFSFNPGALDKPLKDEQKEQLDITVNSGMLRVVNRSIRGIRELDDTEGGDTDTLLVVRRELDGVASCLRGGSFINQKIRLQLTEAWIQLCQIGGWMAYDAQLNNLADYYFKEALSGANHLSAMDLKAHVLACMAYQAAYQGRCTRSLQLAWDATVAARDAHPALQALVLSRYAYAHAASANTDQFHAAVTHARSLLQSEGPKGRPEWLYWFDEEELDVQIGHSLLTLAATSEKYSRDLISEADRLISPKIAPENMRTPRDALFHGGTLARAHLSSGDAERAVEIGWLTLDRLRTVRSPRSIRAIREFADSLRRYVNRDQTGPMQRFFRELERLLPA